ncbi:hypothetical protein WOLCODRAFT_81395 [Wolfiporia cocos MD-104 SS10]|uniref:Uncharacterized protein n=1 Tax=Wolfiporia cocos (strain MD-104) TaxID=742152 RepID=A0A2H3JGT7_WOLCO|nr:hypothetical protein WOLCODRAFT_81395 [Wolfiporia cocos MD-104 SS10]
MYANKQRRLTALITSCTVLITTRICAIVSDLVVVVATWLYALPCAKRVSDTQIKTPLMVVIVRDGEAIEHNSLASIHMTATGTGYFMYSSTFTKQISAMLISRFIFNLRQQVDEENGTWSNDPSFVARGIGSRGSIEFANRLVGNMGATLDYGSPLFDDGDESQQDVGCNEELVSTLTSHISFRYDLVVRLWNKYMTFRAINRMERH